jgi:hypothetical protein
MKIIKHNFTNTHNAHKVYKLPEISNPTIQSGWTSEVLDELHKTTNVVGLREVFREEKERIQLDASRDWLLKYLDTIT